MNSTGLVSSTFPRLSILEQTLHRNLLIIIYPFGFDTVLLHL
jgi:hypothetical protein